MKGYRNDCCGCAAPGYPCNVCGLWHVPYMKCDTCGAEERLYRVGNKELCADCVREAFDYIPEEDAYFVDGEMLTEDELFEGLEIVKIEE